MTLKKERVPHIERGSTRPYFVENLLGNRLSTCHKTNYRMNDLSFRHYINESKDVRICGYFSKPKGVRKQKRLGYTNTKRILMTECSIHIWCTVTFNIRNINWNRLWICTQIFAQFHLSPTNWFTGVWNYDSATSLILHLRWCVTALRSWHHLYPLVSLKVIDYRANSQCNANPLNCALSFANI